MDELYKIPGLYVGNNAYVSNLFLLLSGGEKKKNEPKIDLSKISKTGGEIAKTSIEDVMLALDKMKGDPKLGEQLFTRQGCVACHTLKATDPMKGPFMGQVGSILKKEQIAESILKPNASISCFTSSGVGSNLCGHL